MSGSIPTILPFSVCSIGAYEASVPTLIVPASWYFFGSLLKSGAPDLLGADEPPAVLPELSSFFVWSPHPVSTRAPATATAATAVRRVIAAEGRVERAVIAVSSCEVRVFMQW